MQFIKGSKASRGVLAWAPQILLFSIVFSVFAFQPLFSDSSTRVFAQDAAEPAAAEPAAAEPAPAAAAKPAPKEESLLGWLTDSLGWTYILVFLSLSFILVALFIMNLLSARREYVCPQHLIDGFEAHLEEKQYQEAYELAKTDESFLGNVLSAGLAKLSSSYSASVAAMQEVGADENMKLDHRLSYLALIGTISPMIGLFGTVHGMINSFYVIANGGGTPDPNKLAEGISTALLTTLIGLAIAIPAIAAYNILRNRVQRLVLEVGITSENLMGRFEKVGKKKD
ncbi:MotA/TolQ/ExbB proton channel family protein [Mariniblastus sp.]|jgi:biopolymer transport protein ExbB|nr:MotA/TolQ/ExbB proton channel family protein [bacterium]MDA7922976.1 MotA/TolQ/ExbB proton channel family protein [bacterium]MDB4373006.1 MotA/TolQ/ExbB proton channel family protein [Mariniblastus sp.]MDB4380631.1 MotA/TolQ/ExbB proton channel family protein [Mariniblastus sp.]MDB4481156.1 MotA/TolQ/ExbB proton channel family protein [bacterium]